MSEMNLSLRMRISILFMMIIASSYACSGSGGSGTEDYRPLTEYESNTSAEEPGGNINYPDGYTPPMVTITSPSSGIVIDAREKRVSVSGTLKHGQNKIVSLLINGDDVKILPGNRFSTEVELPANEMNFAAIEASAVDDKGYAGRDRIVILRGSKIASGGKLKNAVGVIVGNRTLVLATRFDEVIKGLLNDAVGKREFDTDYVRIEVVRPFRAVLDLKITGIEVKTGNDVSIRRLTAINPGDTDAGDVAGLSTDMSLKGIEIAADLRFVSIGSLELPADLADTKVTLELNDIAADISLEMGVKDAASLGVGVSSIDLNLKELEADIPSMIILSKLLDGLGISHETYYIKLPVMGWLAKIISDALNEIVNTQGLDLIVYIPEVSLDVDELLPERGSYEMLDSVKGIRDLLVGAQLEKFLGGMSSLGIMAALSGKSKIDKNTGIINIPPSITLSQALDKFCNADLAMSLSAESLNGMLSALNEAGFGISLEIGEILPDLGLPAGMKADVMFGGSPFMDFKDGLVRLFVPNLKAGLYIDSSRQIEVAIDIISEVEAKIFVHGGLPYLKLGLRLNDFRIYYLSDRLGIERAIDIERAVTRLMPQIIELINKWLEENPLIIDVDILKELLSNANGENAELLNEISNKLPFFEISLIGLEADGGYLALGINAR